MQRRRIAIPSVALTALLAGCGPGDGVGLDSNGRPPAESGAAQPPSSDTATFKQVQDTILTPICTACHAGAAAPLGLRLDAANSYALLVNVTAGQASSLKRVLPGDPSNSYLVQKLEGRAATGARMPLGGAALPQSSIDLVKAWIAAGARETASGIDGATRDFTVRSTIPANGEVAAGELQQVTLVMNGDVDASLLAAGAVELLEESTGERVPLAWVRVSQTNAAVVTLRTLLPMRRGSFELRVHGAAAPAAGSAVALGSTTGRLLDVEYRAAFLVVEGGSR